ncbi:MAG: DegT/DnrJ/EryC1/StrS family aminotransferase [Candidatus Aminicenantes bacterium]|nr:MAG: DegT/DnrJ/EryC1/StrS family aminotransferase [Candidatus Aminicenantes bacterium]
MMINIPITKPFFNGEEYWYITKPMETGWVVQGPYVKTFEEKIAQFTGAKYAVAVNSCTSGQFIMSRVLNLKPGDEVIVPAFTWISTANSIEFTGAKALFGDIDIHTFNIDVSQIEEKITGNTKAIYPVALFGLPANMPEIKAIADKYHLNVVEDCACGLGGKIGNTHCGLFGEGGILSFHPRKSITTGEGGMIITNNEHVAKMAASLRDHGAVKTDYDRHQQKGSFLLTDYPYLGYNMRMTDFQGALGVAQSEKLEWIIQAKQKLASEYNERLKEISWLKPPIVPKDYQHGYQTYCTLFKPGETLEALHKKNLEEINKLHEERNRIMYHLEEKGIATRQGTHAVHILQLYREKYNLKPMDLPASYAADRLSIALPFYPTITAEEKDYLFSTLNKVKTT